MDQKNFNKTNNDRKKDANNSALDCWKKPKNHFCSKKDNPNGPAKTNKFTGLNKDELEGIVISEANQHPTAQQFDALFDALIVYAGSCNSKVKALLRLGTYLKRSH